MGFVTQPLTPGAGGQRLSGRVAGKEDPSVMEGGKCRAWRMTGHWGLAGGCGGHHVLPAAVGPGAAALGSARVGLAGHHGMSQCHREWGPSWLSVSHLGAETGSQGSGEGFYSNSCHSLPILDVN